VRLPESWAVALPPACFALTVMALALDPGIARAVVAVAGIGVPLLGALALALFARGGRPIVAVSAVPLVALAGLNTGVPGELAALTLVMLSCVALGSLLAATTQIRGLAIGALLVAALDLALMRMGGIRLATSALLDASTRHMPDFAQPVLGHMTIGYADFFVAALAGAVAARQPSRQTAVAIATTAFALAQYALSTDGELLPSTVPVAVALLAATVAARLSARRTAAAPAVPG
jgi:hypothetical protein